jgi:hypothetical protein
MGLLDWLFPKNKQNEMHDVPKVPDITFSITTEIVKTPISYNIFSSEIEGVPIKAEVPSEAKTRCDELLRKSSRTADEDEYLHDNYWVNVYYKGVRHGYHGINDLWTYSARDLPELPLMHEWLYSILGMKKAEISGDLTTETVREENGVLYVYGTYGSVNIHLSFKPKGFVLSFIINDKFRWNDKASYNTKTNQSDFPFYYSNAEGKIIEWAKRVFEENRTSKQIADKTISEQYNEGWSWLVGFTKWHYFRNGRSLCGSYTHSGSIGLRQGNDDASDKCGSCRRSLLSERRKQENEKQSNTSNKSIERDGQK